MKIFLIILFLFFIQSAKAETYVNQTRLIINESVNETTFTVYNTGAKPSLMKLWSDKNNILERPEEIKMPFTILPAIFRIEGRTSRGVRLQYVGKNGELPTDRESVFWLNVLEIPPVSTKKEHEDVLQVAFRTRIKLFWRPVALKDYTPAQGIKKMVTGIVPCGVNTCLELKNNSVVHLTLTNIQFKNGIQIEDLPNDGMLSPFSTIKIALPSGAMKSDVKSISWIDDYGVINIHNN